MYAKIKNQTFIVTSIIFDKNIKEKLKFRISLKKNVRVAIIKVSYTFLQWNRCTFTRTILFNKLICTMKTSIVDCMHSCMRASFALYNIALINR